MSAKKITVINEKGGVGKSSITWNCAYELARTKKVLIIDLDGQASNLTKLVGIESKNTLPTMYSVLSGAKKMDECIIHLKDNLDIIPANVNEVNISMVASARKMKNALKEIENRYDYIFIDVGPSPTPIHQYALCATNNAIIPTLLDIATIDGTTEVCEDILDIQDSGNPNLNVLGILINKYNGRLNLSKEVMEVINQLVTSLQFKMFDTKIRNAVSMAECFSAHIGVTDYDPSSAVAEDIRNVCKEIEERAI